MKRQYIFKNAGKLFPAKVTRISPHDFMNLAVKHKQNLSKREFSLLNELADFNSKKGFSGYSDVLIKRNGRRINLIPF